MRRVIWMGAGVAAGAGGTLWAQWRLRQQLRRLGGDALAASAVASAGRTAATLRAAMAAGREERARREAELWDALDGTAGRSTAHPDQRRPGLQPVGASRASRATFRPPVPQGRLRGGRHSHR